MSDEKSNIEGSESSANSSISDIVEPNCSMSDCPNDDFIVGEENEPYLGMSWPVLMFVLYVLKTLFPAETFSILWWFQWYILLIVFGVTVFALLKRYKYSKLPPQEKEFPVKNFPDEF